MEYPACAGCGYCCMKAQCNLSIITHGRKEKCPELIWVEDRYRCLLVIRSDDTRLSLCIGEGCTSVLNIWRKDVKMRL